MITHNLNSCLNVFIQNRNLNSVYKKSGAGQVPVEEQLTEFELTVLAYLGETPSTGIPNVGRAPVKPGEDQLLLTPEVKANRTNMKSHNYVSEAAAKIFKGDSMAPSREKDVVEITSSMNSDAERGEKLPIKDPTEEDFEDPSYPASHAECDVEVLCK